MMKKVLSILLVCGMIVPLASQTLSSSDTKKFNDAVSKRKMGEMDKALKILDKLILKYPENQNLFLEKGVLYIDQKDQESAAEYFEAAWELDPSASHRLSYTLATLYKDLDRFDESLEKLQHFYTFKNVRPAQMEIAKKLEQQIYFTEEAKANPVDITLERLSDNINTSNSEYLPSFTADGKTLIYTSRAGKQEDFYISSIDTSGFLPGVPLTDLNTDQNEGAHCISPDGLYLFFTACHIPGNIGGCDLYITTKKEGAWIKPINMGPEVNSRNWDAQPSLTPDGKRLYFASERKGGLGKSDIWYVNFENGKWSKPINAGPEINTKENESSPFIHLDGQSLYFRSDGHIGLGSYDLFLSRLENELWGEPQNLGYPINSTGNDGALNVSNDGKYAYYASDMDGEDLDIYRFELPEHLKPKAVTYFKALVIDNESKEVLTARIEVFDVANDKKYLTSQTNDNGEVLATIPEGSEYSIHVSAKDYIFYSENISWVDSTSVNNPQEIIIELEKISVPEKTKKETKPVILKNIFFASGSSELLATSNFEIEKLVSILENASESRIRIMGHTDNVGSETDNNKLSLDRANAVKAALTSKGIDAARIIAKGMGESQPIDSNETEEGRSNNRRTEFVLIRQ